MYTEKFRFSNIKKLCPTAHIKLIKLDNGIRGYCNKEDTRRAGPWSFGEFEKQGRPKLARDLVNLKEDELLDLPPH